MIQALPTVGSPSVYNAISLGAAFYANALGRHILNLNPKAASVFKMWKNEADQASLTSALEKNQELKDIVLNETPWVMDANRENTQKQRLADFFDQNLMQSRLDETVKRLGKLQCSDGSWAWFEHMQGSFYMTVAVSEMLVRLNAMAGEQADTREMLNGAFRFMGHEMVVLVDDIKKRAKETGIEPTFPSFSALEWLYLTTLDGRELPSDVQTAPVIDGPAEAAPAAAGYRHQYFFKRYSAGQCTGFRLGAGNAADHKIVPAPVKGPAADAAYACRHGNSAQIAATRKRFSCDGRHAGRNRYVVHAVTGTKCSGTDLRHRGRELHPSFAAGALDKTGLLLVVKHAAHGRK